MFERPANGDKALLVALDVGRDDARDRGEITALAESAGATVVGGGGGGRARPPPADFAGRGTGGE